MPRDFNSLTFIDQARVIHGYRYDYGVLVYRGIDAPIRVHCKIHGEFEITPNQHLIGDGCPKCST